MTEPVPSKASRPGGHSGAGAPRSAGCGPATPPDPALSGSRALSRSRNLTAGRTRLRAMSARPVRRARRWAGCGTWTACRGSWCSLRTVTAPCSHHARYPPIWYGNHPFPAGRRRRVVPVVLACQGACRASFVTGPAPGLARLGAASARHGPAAHLRACTPATTSRRPPPAIRTSLGWWRRFRPASVYSPNTTSGGASIVTLTCRSPMSPPWSWWDRGCRQAGAGGPRPSRHEI
jgi:hypothetical protein